MQTSEQSRRGKAGKDGRERTMDSDAGTKAPDPVDEGGEAPCWAHLLDDEGHMPERRREDDLSS